MSISLLQNEPFETLTCVAAKYFHPEDYYTILEELKLKAQLPEEQQPTWLRKFKFEAKEYLLKNAEGFDEGRFFHEVQFDDGRTELFLRRAWAETFPEEPIPGVPNLPFDSLYTIIHIYFGSPEVDSEEFYIHPDYLRRQFEHGDAQRSPLLRAIKPDLTRMLRGDFEGLDMVRFRSETYAFYFRFREDDKDFARHVWGYLFPDEPLPDPMT